MVWVGMDQRLVLTGFPWNGLGVGIVNELVIIQVADIVGVTGISFVIIFAQQLLHH